MAINQKDIKLLWGRSGNLCAICKGKLSQDSKAVPASYTLGEQAHIVGEKESAARGRSPLIEKERNSYHNLILLCPTHHTEIDENEHDWPVEKLHQIKSEHELYVQETLTSVNDQSKLAEHVAVTSVIDSAVNLCDLENWNNWSSWAMSAEPRWDVELPDKIFDFRAKVIAAIWPDDLLDLRQATSVFSILILKSVNTFMEHCDRRGNVYCPHKFYKAYGWNENYDEDVKEYEDWIKRNNASMREVAKAVNWFADVVRRDINPMFFVESGKFLVSESDILSGTELFLLEFTSEEKAKYLKEFDLAPN